MPRLGLPRLLPRRLLLRRPEVVALFSSPRLREAHGSHDLLRMSRGDRTGEFQDRKHGAWLEPKDSSFSSSPSSSFSSCSSVSPLWCSHKIN